MKRLVEGLQYWVLAAMAAQATVACGGAARAGRTGPHNPSSIGVEAAELPARVLRARGGNEVSEATFYGELAKSAAVCVGESHNNPHHHWVQLRVLDRLSASQKTKGIMLGLGMEMFQRPYQGVLDDYVAGRIDEPTMLSRTNWKKRWGYDYKLYAPMIRMARKRGIRIIALNTARELIKKVSKGGLDNLTPSERARLPELVLDDKDHRAWFDALMRDMAGGHGHTKKKSPHKSPHEPANSTPSMAERIYTSQVVWDETMADTAARWLADGPNRQIIVLAGNGHCHDSAIVKRIRRRGPTTAVSIQPIIDDGKGNVAEALATPRNEYLFVMSPKR